MTRSRQKALYEALKATGFNQSAAGRLLRVSRETVRQWLLEVGGKRGLIAWAVQVGLATQAEADALAALVALAPANRQGANYDPGGLAAEAANPSEIRHFPTAAGVPIFAADMSTVATPVPQSSTIRLDGPRREFAKRVALEFALKAGRPREDMSEVVARMIEYFRRLGDPGAVADLLLQSEAAANKGGGE